MELRSLKNHSLLTSLGLIESETNVNFNFDSSQFKRYLITSIRNIYSTSNEGILARSVKVKLFNQIKNLLIVITEPEKLKESINTAHELLESVGEIVLVETTDSLKKFRSQLSMYVLLSSAVRDKKARALLIGPCWNLDEVSLPSSLILDQTTGLRYLIGNLDEIKTFMDSIKLHEISLNQWRGYPPALKHEEILSLVSSKLLAAPDARDVRDLLIFEKGFQRYFLKRLRGLKSSDNGIFVARKITEFGSYVSYAVFIQNGVCRKIMSLPIQEIAIEEKDCERLLISAFDLEVGLPTKVTEEIIKFDNMFNFISINLFIPPVSWMLKYLIASGNQLTAPNRGALISFAIPGENRDGILQQLKKDMFLEVSDERKNER